MMKKFSMFTLCICITVLCAATLGFAQAPQILNFQGRLNDSSGNPVTDGYYSIQFSIYPVASGGTAVWNQTQAVTTKNGVFNVLLNDVTLDLTTSEHYLAMKVGSDSEMAPRQSIASVPYALNADKLDGIEGNKMVQSVNGVSPDTHGNVNISGGSTVWQKSGDNIYYNNGKVGIATTTPQKTLHVNGDTFLDGGRTFLGFDSYNHHWIGIPGSSEPENLLMGFSTSDGKVADSILISPRGNLGIIVIPSGNVGIGTTSPYYKLDVNGTLHVRGQDIAEPFEMTDLDTLELGDVVVIDPQNPLHVTKSTTAYDTTVAGIVSSGDQAGYVAGSRSDGTSDKPIALVGRVLCNVSGENGPIQIGDLLTTSNTPGHAMKATDFPKAYGAIMGKALQSFDGEKGQIMVLVTLQ